MKELKEATRQINRISTSNRVLSLEIEQEWLPKLKAIQGKYGESVDDRLELVLQELRELAFDLR